MYVKTITTYLYSQQLGSRLGANEQAEGAYTEYMAEGARVCNNAENSSAKSIFAGLYHPVRQGAILAL